MLCKSSALFTQTPPQYNMAIEAYQQTADKCQEIITNKKNKGPIEWTNGGILYLYLFESLRILGYCQEQLGRHHAAFKPYVKAVNAAEEMNEDIRKNVALKSVGISLLQLCRKLGKKNEYFVVIDKINGLLGVGWEKDVSKPKTIK